MPSHTHHTRTRTQMHTFRINAPLKSFVLDQTDVVETNVRTYMYKYMYTFIHLFIYHLSESHVL